MTNVIVYAMYSDREDIDNLMQWREFLYSIKTLREYNKDIDVKVYISPSDRVNNISRLPDMHNIEIIGVDNPVTHSIPNEQVAKWLDMKYNAAFDTFESYKYDRILMIDSDTIYQDDPEKIFNKYNKDIFYACPDGFDELFSAMKTSDKFMNDGVVILPRWSLEIKDKLLESRNGYVEELINKLDGSIDKNSDLWIYGVLWASFQYGIYEYLKSKNNQVQYFDNKDVGTLMDWLNMHYDENYRPAIIHYWSGGYKTFLPPEYLDGIDDIMHKSISSS